MAERLGNVLYWAANSIAALLLFFGVPAGYVYYAHGTMGRPAIVLCGAAIVTWLVGRLSVCSSRAVTLASFPRLVLAEQARNLVHVIRVATLNQLRQPIARACGRRKAMTACARKAL